MDPFDGRRDIERRVLRVVDPERFADDSLRVLRAVQFAARLDFTLDDGARQLCRAIPLDDLPPERIWGEVEKLLFAPRPSIGFALARDLGVVATLFPELDALAGCPQEPEWHPEGDVWVHTLQVIDQARGRIDDLERPRQIAVMLGAVCHDLGKPATTAVIDGRIRSLDHEEQGVAPTHSFLDRVNIQSMNGYDVRQQVAGLVAQHLNQAPGTRSATRSGMARSGGSPTKWTSNCWHESRRLIASDAVRASSTAPPWTGFSTGPVRWASSIVLRRRSC